MFCQAWKETNNFPENQFVNETVDNLVTFSAGRKKENILVHYEIHQDNSPRKMNNFNPFQL